MTDKKHEQQLRLKAIELIAYWEGRLVTNRLMSWFGISRQQASNDIKRYLAEYNPKSLTHDPGVKAYVPSTSFSPKITKGSVDEYLTLISTFSDQATEVTVEPEAHFASVQLPDRSVRPEVLRELLKACRSNSSVKILYASMTNPVWNERVISPHTLVYTGFRWHVRAYCHKRCEFRDFILSRIDRTPKAATEASPDPIHDSLWNEQILLTIVPNPKLNDGQKALVEKDFGMPDGRLQISVRKAVAHYTLQRYQAAITVDEAADEFKFPIILLDSDRKKLSPFLFGSES